MAGASISELKEILGHGNINVTMRYSHFLPEHLKSTIEKLPY